MKKFLYPILILFVFMATQAVAGIMIAGVSAASHPEALEEMMNTGDTNVFTSMIDTDSLSVAIIASGFVTIVVLALMRMIDWKKVLNVKMIDWENSWYAIVGAVAGVFALDVIEEMLDLPDLMEQTFTGMANSTLGVLSIAVLGPIVEEFVFREGIEGYMLRKGVSKWWAIGISAFIFGIVHLNPAQVPFAAAMGVLFGIIYYKSGNIVLTTILHIVNNSVAVWQMNVLGEDAKDFKIVEWLGGTWTAAGAICAGLGLCGLWMINFWHLYRAKEITNNNY